MSPLCATALTLRCRSTPSPHRFCRCSANDKTVAPSASAWTEAAVLAGILARTQGLAVPKRALNADLACCQQGRRRGLLLDALIYVTAVEHDMLLISANIRHMDLLLQLHPTGNVLLYRPAADAPPAGSRA